MSPGVSVCCMCRKLMQGLLVIAAGRSHEARIKGSRSITAACTEVARQITCSVCSLQMSLPHTSRDPGQQGKCLSRELTSCVMRDSDSSRKASVTNFGVMNFNKFETSGFRELMSIDVY